MHCKINNDMKTLKIERAVTKEEVYVKAESVEDSFEIRTILEAAEEVVDESNPYNPQKTYLMFDGVDNDWFYNWGGLGHFKITIPQLAELLGVEYPLKPKFEAGKWYISEVRTNIFCHNGKFDGDEDPCGYGVVHSGSWVDANDVGWSGPYREATPSEVEKALIAEAKRRYEVGDKLSMIVQDCAPGRDGRVYPSNPSFGYAKYGRLWLDQEYSYCIFADGKWAEVVEQKQLPTLEELIAEAKSKITKKTREFPCWVEGTREIEVYRIGGTKYMTEKLAIIGYITKRLREEYL